MEADVAESYLYALGPEGMREHLSWPSPNLEWPSSDSRVAGVALDAYDVEYLHVYEIEKR